MKRSIKVPAKPGSPTPSSNHQITESSNHRSGYPGSKNGHGVKQAIRNQVPLHKTLIIGFLGNDPLFRELPVSAAKYGFEISTEVIAQRWPGFKVADAAKSSYVSLPDIHALTMFTGSMWKNRYQAAGAAIFNCDFLKWFAGNAAKLGSDTFIYLDPPYLISTQKDVEREYYKYVLTDHQHRELLKLCRSTKALVAISGYDNPLYAKMLAKWRKVKYQRRTHSGMVEECLWMNYPEPVQLADYSCIGDNHITRQTFKRKVHRWLHKLAAMKEKERNALLEAIRKKYPG